VSHEVGQDAPMMTKPTTPSRDATCSCGALHLTARGNPVRIGLCHCTECQRRTGSVFGIQAWFDKDGITINRGEPKIYVRTTDSGNRIDFRFCGTCGTTLWWTAEQRPDWIGVAAGTFTDATLPAPGFSSFERHRHAWTTNISDLPLVHHH
jgi:hypothetical protein